MENEREVYFECIKKIMFLRENGYDEQANEFHEELEIIEAEINADEASKLVHHPHVYKLRDKIDSFIESSDFKIDLKLWLKENEQFSEFWERFYNSLDNLMAQEDAIDLEFENRKYAKIAVEILIEQDEKEKCIDLMTPLSYLDTHEEFVCKYFVGEIIKRLKDFIQKNFSQEEQSKLEHEIDTLFIDKESILENIGKHWIWEIIIGKRQIDIAYFYRTKKRTESGVQESDENKKNKNEENKQDVLNVFEPVSILKRIPFIYPVCTLIASNGSKCEYTSWHFREADYRNFLKAETIIFYRDIPASKVITFNALRVSKYEYLKVLKFENGVSIVPKVFDASVCPNIEEIYISGTVTEIKDDAFQGLNSIKKIIIDMVSPKAKSLIIERCSAREIEINTQEESQKLVLKNCNNIERVTIGGKAVPFYSIVEGLDSYIYLSEEQLKEATDKEFGIKYKEHKDGDVKEKAYCRFYDEKISDFKNIRMQRTYSTRKEAEKELRKLTTKGIKAVIGPAAPFIPGVKYCHNDKWSTIYIIDFRIKRYYGHNSKQNSARTVRDRNNLRNVISLSDADGNIVMKLHIDPDEIWVENTITRENKDNEQMVI